MVKSKIREKSKYWRVKYTLIVSSARHYFILKRAVCGVSQVLREGVLPWIYFTLHHSPFLPSLFLPYFYFWKWEISRPLPSMMLLRVPIGIILDPCTGTMTCRPLECLHFWWLPFWPAKANPLFFKTRVISLAERAGNFGVILGRLLQSLSWERNCSQKVQTKGKGLPWHWRWLLLQNLLHWCIQGVQEKMQTIDCILYRAPILASGS